MAKDSEERLKWNKVVFNHKLCDHEPNCTEIPHCIAAFGGDKSKAAIWYDEVNRRVTLDESKCSCESLCKCLTCPLFIKIDNENEYWFETDKIKKTKRDPNFRNKDMYSSGWVSPCHRITVEIVEQRIANEDTFILEINNKIGCLAEYVLIEILSLMPKDIYDLYYKKLLLTSIHEIEKMEALLDINELPCILLIIDGKIVQETHGIYKSDNPGRAKILKDKVKDFCFQLRRYNNG